MGSQRVGHDWATELNWTDIYMHNGFPDGSEVKNLPVMQKMQEIRVQSLGWEDPLEEDMVTNSSILAWRIPWTEESRGLQAIESQRVRRDWSNWVHTDVCIAIHSEKHFWVSRRLLTLCWALELMIESCFRPHRSFQAREGHNYNTLW